MAFIWQIQSLSGKWLLLPQLCWGWGGLCWAAWLGTSKRGWTMLRFSYQGRQELTRIPPIGCVLEKNYNSVPFGDHGRGKSSYNATAVKIVVFFLSPQKWIKSLMLSVSEPRLTHSAPPKSKDISVCPVTWPAVYRPSQGRYLTAVYSVYCKFDIWRAANGSRYLTMNRTSGL